MCATEMYILPVIGSGADADNGMAHLVSFIHSVICEAYEARQSYWICLTACMFCLHIMLTAYIELLSEPTYLLVNMKCRLHQCVIN